MPAPLYWTVEIVGFAVLLLVFSGASVTVWNTPLGRMPLSLRLGLWWLVLPGLTLLIINIALSRII